MGKKRVQEEAPWLLKWQKEKRQLGCRTPKLGGGFGAEDALEARSSKLDANELFAAGLGIRDMDDAALGGKVCFAVSRARKAVIVSGARITAGVSGGEAVIASATRRAGGATRGVVRKRDANFQVGANGDVKARYEGSAVAAKIFAGSFFFEEDAVFVAAAKFDREMDGDSTFRALPRYGRAHWDHGLGPRFW
jgi:hypothetical protein